MNTERFIRIFAGTMILLSLALGLSQSPMYSSGYFLWVAVFVGANMLQSGFTRFCLLEIMLRKAGVPSGTVAAK